MTKDKIDWNPASGEPSPLEPEYYQALGEMTVLFSRLHYFVEMYLFLLLDVRRQVGFVLTAKLQLSQLIQRLEAVFAVRARNENDVKELHRITAKIYKAIALRNQLTHSLWFIGDSEPVFYRLRSEDGPREKPITLNALRTFNRSVEESMGDLLKFMITPATTTIVRDNKHCTSKDEA